MTMKLRRNTSQNGCYAVCENSRRASNGDDRYLLVRTAPLWPRRVCSAILLPYCVIAQLAFGYGYPHCSSPSKAKTRYDVYWWWSNPPPLPPSHLLMCSLWWRNEGNEEGEKGVSWNISWSLTTAFKRWAVPISNFKCLRWHLREWSCDDKVPIIIWSRDIHGIRKPGMQATSSNIARELITHSGNVMPLSLEAMGVFCNCSNKIICFVW